MTLKRLVLVILTALAVLILVTDLLSSWSQPQFQSRLELYQTDLLLQATEWQGGDAPPETQVALRKALLGADPLKAATKQYQEAQRTVQKTLEAGRAELDTLQISPVPAQSNNPLQLKPSKTQIARQEAAVKQQERLLDELDIRLGLLQVQQDQTVEARQTWQAIPDRASNSVSRTAEVLLALWNEPAQLLPEADRQLQAGLDGWFRYVALSRLYQLQQRADSLAQIQAQAQQTAEKAVSRLAIVVAVPSIGFLIGLGILVFLVAQRLLQGKQSVLGSQPPVEWATPWDGDTIWAALVTVFFAQIFLPLIFVYLQQSFGLRTGLGERGRAGTILLDYGFMALGGLGALYWFLRPFFPLPADWFRISFRGNWFWWGLGGYFVALPLVIAVSLINQQIWHGQGGSNPILPIVLQGKDTIALLIFFITAAVAAPLYEETLFRGFLLPSLTRFFPLGGAIALSGLLFAIAHRSLSELLPLTVLGMVLGFVYSRSRNLLASMLLHGLWNSGTLLSLFLLGNATR